MSIEMENVLPIMSTEEIVYGPELSQGFEYTGEPDFKTFYTDNFTVIGGTARLNVVLKSQQDLERLMDWTRVSFQAKNGIILNGTATQTKPCEHFKEKCEPNKVRDDLFCFKLKKEE